jgi:phosphohistidine swiveling domain-containing protein
MTSEDSDGWLTAVARQHTPLFLSMVLRGQTRERIEYRAGLACGFRAARRRGLALEYPRADIAAARAEVRARWRAEGLRFFDDYATRCLASCEELLALAQSLAIVEPDDPESPRDQTDRINSYVQGVIDHSAFLQTLIVTQFELEDALGATVAERIDAHEERERIADALKFALKPTHEMLNLTGMLELGQSVQASVENWRGWLTAHPADLIIRVAERHPDIWAQVETYVREFGWMGRMYYAGEPMVPGEVILRLQNMLNHDCARRLDAIDSARKSSLAERDRAVACLGSDERARQLADIVSRYMHLRSYRLDVYFIAHERMVDMLAAVARGCDLGSYQDVVYLDCRELMAASGGGEGAKILRNRIADRQRGFEFELSDGEITWDAPVTSDTPAGAAPAGPLTGVTACRGKVQGRVRLLASDDDTFAMEVGEILVTTMTMPSLMLAVEKAAAIVTDEGGMLCHAAIVSRELDIPCVIATGTATRRLRTGDLVEVDADNAIVHILS